MITQIIETRCATVDCNAMGRSRSLGDGIGSPTSGGCFSV